MTASTSLFDPVGEPAASAANWLTELLTGSAATALCVIAVATLGMMMLSGRISLRRGFRVVFGCFLVLGASVAAAELQQIVNDAGAEAAPQVIEITSPPKPLPPPSYQPFAAASRRRQ